MRFGHQLTRLLFVVAAGFSVMLFQRCGSEDPVTPSPTVDYFPINRNLVGTFTSNISAPRGVPVTIFEMKIDTASHWNGPTEYGVYHWYFVRVPSQSQEWRHYRTH